MLIRLLVEDLVVLERADVTLRPGLNVITGETGAGKTVLASALSLLLGARMTADVVRAGSTAAYVEGHFACDPAARELLLADERIAALWDEDAEHLVLGRRVTAQGRSSCLLGGRTCSREVMAAAAGHVLAFYGQHEQQRLLDARAQAVLLDGSGDAHGQTLHGVYLAARRAYQTHVRACELAQSAYAQGRREADLIAYELEELEELGALESGEADRLERQLRRIDSAEQALAAASAVHGLLLANSGAVGRITELSGILAGIDDPQVQAQRARLESAAIEVDDIAVEVRSLLNAWDTDLQGRAGIEARMQALTTLARKHRCDVDALAEVREKLRSAAEDAAELPNRIAELEQAVEDARAHMRDAGESLSAWRAARAPALSDDVAALLGELSMEGARFVVDLVALETPSEVGAEQVQFTLAGGPGMPLRPLAAVASGGELSRILLALLSVAHDQSQATLVLDEPDAGLGGRTARGVAGRLQDLATSRQVIVISHLAQLAARASHHLVLRKDSSGAHATTTLFALQDEEDRLDELVRMGGHDVDSDAAREAMRQLRG